MPPALNNASAKMTVPPVKFKEYPLFDFETKCVAIYLGMWIVEVS